MKHLTPAYYLAIALVIIGGLNWGLVGAFNFDLVATLLGDMSIFSRVVYGLVGISAAYIALNTLAVSKE
jgi:uncharacterized membrane protein YuzA (DUF378 family)